VLELRSFDDVHDEDNPDRWLVSYADFITLLLALFVVLYAMSSVQEKKYSQLKQSVKQALGQSHQEVPSMTTSPAELEQPTSQKLNPAANDRLEKMAADLEKKLASLIASDTVKIRRSAQGVSIEINASILFPMGEANLQPQSVGTLEQISQAVKEYKSPIHVAGHTDNVHINSKEFPSNWELSAARASRVVRLFESNGVARQQMQAIGYADTQPITSNETVEGRMQNRRVQITLEIGASTTF
jgi:chemotaxis protein MotB